MSTEPKQTPAASCEDCGFAWYSATSAEALRTLSGCVHCGGKLSFPSQPATPPVPDPAARQDVPAHLAFGRPRLN